MIREITHGCSFTKQQHNIQENIEHHSSTLSISSSDLHHLFCFSACPSFTFSYSSFIYQVIAHKSSKPFFFSSLSVCSLCHMSVSQTRFYRPSVGNFITCSLIPRPSSIRCLTLLVLIIHPVLVGYQSILPVALSQSSHSSLYEALRSIFLPLLLIPPRTLFHVF